jgi:O-methyltransferase involved in polyketide biosynthesis
MYLRPEKVSSLMRTLSSLSTPGSQVAFTFMEKGSDGRIRFDSQSKLVDWRLHRRGESFLWGLHEVSLLNWYARGELSNFSITMICAKSNPV